MKTIRLILDLLNSIVGFCILLGLVFKRAGVVHKFHNINAQLKDDSLLQLSNII